MKRKSVKELRNELEIKSRFLGIIEDLESRRDWYLKLDENGEKYPPEEDWDNYDFIMYTSYQKAIDILADSIQ